MLARSPLVASLVLTLGFDPGAAPEAVALRFAPEPGLALRKSFQGGGASESRVVRSSMAGEEQDIEHGHESETKARLVFVDRCLEVDGDRALAFDRTYEEFEQESHSTFEQEGGPIESDAVATNELDGLTVRFTWNADDGRYVPTCDEAEDEWLEELEADRDYAALLPDDEVEAEDEWKIAAQDFQALTRAFDGLPLDWEHERGGEAVEEASDLGEAEVVPETEEHEEVSGEITARFEGLRELDGRELAVIALKGKFESTLRASGSTDGAEHGDASFAYETRTETEVLGECLWDLAAGHLHALTVELTTKGEAEERSTFEMMGSTLDLETDSEIESKSTLDIRFERVE